MTSENQQGGTHLNTRRKVLAVAAGAGLVSLGGVIGAAFVKSPEQFRAEAAGPDATVLTARVEKRVLASTVITRGAVGATHQVEVTPATAAGASTALVTGVYREIGARVQPGDLLLSVSGRPLIALPGPLAAYRDLRPGDSGLDVEQLHRALRALKHYAGGDRVGVFGPATKLAVRRLYRRVGYAVPDTGGFNGRGDLPALRAAADAVELAQAEVDAAQASVAGQGQLAAAKRKLARAKDDQAALIATTGPMVPMAELAYLAAFPATVVSVGAVGQPVKAPLIVLSSGALEVACRMRPDQVGALQNGMKAQITSESLGNSTSGTITSIGPLTTDTETSATGAAPVSSGAAYRLVTVTPTKALGSEWNRQDVRVAITAAQTPGEVLVVPVSALSAGADGKTTVSVVAGDGQQRLVEVRPGISGDGFFEVTPVNDDLVPGSRVVIGK
ncbi:peptidoglycan hydrolase-like protein with peptidoglycan-binding domain [Hamadaea flava]|uniref:Peptidoglycan binding protein n=1 Tax=Hamadaea flava TaxID=1742688 RepID=A0ABV8LZW9_9ACTN|nr:hypothetical protein [Hamadaea flava]MCP2327014.1 peptidoglycan hydrolase-like protein with peptidoglycan-binding domain [Hamadaea flava]